MGLREYVIKRAVESILIVFIILIFNFILIHIAPGDPVAILTRGGGTVFGGGKEMVEAIRQRFGLDKPLQEQLIIYFANVIHGDFGYSFFRGKPVIDLIVQRIPATLLLMLVAQIPAIVFGTLIGAYSAKKLNSKIDSIITILSSSAYSAPQFWFGMLLIIFFAFTLRWFPSSGMVSVTTDLLGFNYITDVLWHLALPAFALFLSLLPVFIRTSRASVIETMKEDFVTTYRAIGLSENKLFFRRILRNALLPIVTTAGLVLGYTLTGATLIETLFAWPGMGKLMYDSILLRDYPVILGIFFFASLCVVLTNFVIDIIYALLDPRVGYR
jgi:peptide/nickel transport system permease protein